MTVLAAGAISITDGAIVITAETDAPQLGVKPEALQFHRRSQWSGARSFHSTELIAAQRFWMGLT